MNITKNYITIYDNEFLYGVWDIYEKSFPITEMRSLTNLRSVMQGEHCRVVAYHDMGEVIGFIIFWEYAEFVYIEFFATNPSMRNGGYGAYILRDFIAEHGNKPLILEIDGMSDEISKRRCGFYQREGFVLNDFVHRPTAYNDKSLHLEMHIMTYGDKISEKEYLRFNKRLTEEIMSNLYNPFA